MSTHAKLSPSGSTRWLKCPGSINLCDKLNIKDKSSIYADEGTIAHRVGEICLLKKTEPIDHLGEVFLINDRAIEVTQNMVDAVTMYTDYIREDLLKDDEVLIEVKCCLKSLGIPGLDGGTADCIIVNKKLRTIRVIDYKHGAGVAVDATDNTQLMSYGLGALIKLGIRHKGKRWRVSLTIVQPRAPHGMGPFRTVELTSKDLYSWCINTLMPGAEATLEPHANLVPSEEGCRWCPAAGQCPALFNKTQDLAVADFESLVEISPHDIKVMSSEQKIKIVANAKMLCEYIAAVQKQVFSEIQEGSNAYKGTFKIVQATTNRRFKHDAFEAGSQLDNHLDRHQLFQTKVRTQKEIKDALKEIYGSKTANKVIDLSTEKPEGKPILVKIKDNRKELSSNETNDFDDLI